MATSNSLSKANTSFSLALFKKLSEDNTAGNVFYSPFSISSALAMVLLGARGNTATQMSEITKAEESEADIHEDFAKVMSEILKPGAPYALSIANRLYAEQTYNFVEDFLALTRKHYNAELEAVDFAANAEEARLKINSWVEEQTQDKIKDLLEQGAVDTLTKLVLVNAIYFKGNWARQFKEEFTQDAEFRINKNDTKPVKMMFQKADFRFNMIPEAKCKILELPYEGNDLSMLIILPEDIEDETTGLEKLEKEMTYELFVEWTRPDAMREVEVQVKLPRFKMEEEYDLKDVLVRMGMVDAFDISKSDFSGMTTANNLVLSKVIHKSYVDVNEEGTEAVAATAVVMEVRSVRISTTFYADHPFLLYIRHNPTMTVLFAGRFSSPA